MLLLIILVLSCFAVSLAAAAASTLMRQIFDFGQMEFSAGILPTCQRRAGWPLVFLLGRPAAARANGASTDRSAKYRLIWSNKRSFDLPSIGRATYRLAIQYGWCARL
jgi:hypothetical protein